MRRASGPQVDFATDAVAAVEVLKSRPEVDAKRIGLLGHSEGGVVAPIAAARSNDVAFIVLISGMGVTGERILLDQAELIGRAGGAPDGLTRPGRRRCRSASSRQCAARGWTRSRPTLAEPRDAQDGPGEQRARRDRRSHAYVGRMIAGQLAMARSPWFKFFLDYDPAATLRKVRCPVLASFGEKDQAAAESNCKAIAEALSPAADRRMSP